ncbi:MAG: transcription factor S [Candidatus Huberarchaeum crystalense]|uniref:Transcription factor S n=1 Tax=Huberarchaeum crystalense TaxID=2014257 RepID=A0A2H9QSW5_HUBC1|nr:transcription factor S [archaeon]OIP20540.1 MAG: transcription factor S [archaeon CG2_30_31_98]PIV13924.1 MAG: transcription factor S [Candidatus Huberarchaeum crystalense]PIV46466.1 MAG: transcription factor S [Candidatus Huberarchaeum crystalense]PIV89609.1 MAG: transcription factor S [Candidatus Huberarchaeum crystalense]
MIFCNKCGGLCSSRKQGEKTIFVCRCCGTEQTEKKGRVKACIICESIEKSEKKVSIFNEDIETKKLPTVKHGCPKCSNLKAVFWMKQTRASDEPPTRFYKCLKCGYISREYE